MKRILLSFIAGVSLTFSVSAQLPGVPTMPTAAAGDFATFAQLFGKTAFTARAEVRQLDKSTNVTISSVMDLAMADGMLCLEVDMAKTKNKDLPPGTTTMLKNIDMDVVRVLIRPDRASMYFIFEKASAYITQPMEKSDVAKANKSKLTTVKLGEETVDGHPCVKNQTTITAPDGSKDEITVWNATDLKNLPIKTVEKNGTDTIITRYTKIQFGRPPASKFEPPAEAVEYKGIAEFTQSIIQRSLGIQPEDK